MITVIDLNIGNVNSVGKALKFLNVEYVVSSCHKDILRADKLILPGVGNFTEAAKRLKSSGIDKLIKNRVTEEKIPLLGICLGMQLLASYGEEGGGAEGLDLIKGIVTFHRAARKKMHIPHIGWNDVSFENFMLFNSIPKGSCFYFVHSYELLPHETIKMAYSNYGIDFVSAVQKKNVIGVQFHPEKSQGPGLQLLKNFAMGISDVAL